ncbi:LysR family transcriptional regulator [Herbaspirillum huttiense]|uniref:LysR family transcriptional regulator n=1 Tax=Herbaspirillum huttiense TaxID=863372 RepID=UPI0039AF4480
MTMFNDLHLLRSFVTIVDCGSISAAARALHMTQPTLSRQLGALEEQCGAELLRRDTHRMSLTDSGQRFLQDARALIELADEAQQRLRQEQGGLQGNIRVFSTIDFGQTVVSRLISSFIQAHPGVTMELSYSNRPVHMIEEGCDAGIIAGTLTDERVVARSLGQIRRHVVASPGLVAAHKRCRRPEDLQAWPWLILASANFGGTREVMLYGEGDQEHRLQVQPVLVSEGVTSLREAARMDLGVAVLPTWLAEEDLVSGRLVRLLPRWEARSIPAHVVYPVRRTLPLRVRTFVDYATQYMATALAAPRRG